MEGPFQTADLLLRMQVTDQCWEMAQLTRTVQQQLQKVLLWRHSLHEQPILCLAIHSLDEQPTLSLAIPSLSVILSLHVGQSLSHIGGGTECNSKTGRHGGTE